MTRKIDWLAILSYSILGWFILLGLLVFTAVGIDVIVMFVRRW